MSTNQEYKLDSAGRSSQDWDRGPGGVREVGAFKVVVAGGEVECCGPHNVLIFGNIQIQRGRPLAGD